MNDVANRLNRWLETSLRGDEIPDSWVEEAAEEIERLNAKIVELQDKMGAWQDVCIDYQRAEAELRAMNERLLAKVEKLQKDNELLGAINRLTVQ